MVMRYLLRLINAKERERCYFNAMEKKKTVKNQTLLNANMNSTD